MTDCNYKPDVYEVCPYNSDHKILSHRFVVHLVKCAKNYPSGYLSICPFDVRHRIPPKELDEHSLTCPARIHLASLQASLKEVPTFSLQPHKRDPRDDEPLVEDWDNGPSCTAYDPQAKCLAAKIVRPPPRNSTKSERKKFVEEEKLRFQTIREQEEAKQCPLEQHKQNGFGKNLPNITGGNLKAAPTNLGRGQSLVTRNENQGFERTRQSTGPQSIGEDGFSISGLSPRLGQNAPVRPGPLNINRQMGSLSIQPSGARIPLSRPPPPTLSLQAGRGMSNTTPNGVGQPAHRPRNPWQTVGSAGIGPALVPGNPLPRMTGPRQRLPSIMSQGRGLYQ